MPSGHFSQVVWKGSEDIGVGKAKTKDGAIIVVCNYFPAGNVVGSYRENVSPAGDGRIRIPVKNGKQHTHNITHQFFSFKLFEAALLDHFQFKDSKT